MPEHSDTLHSSDGGTTSTSQKPTNTAASPVGSPVIVDLGSAKRKRIKELHQGKGVLTARVMEVISQLQADGTIGPMVQPVIVVIKKKPRSSSLARLF